MASTVRTGSGERCQELPQSLTQATEAEALRGSTVSSRATGLGGQSAQQHWYLIDQCVLKVS